MEESQGRRKLSILTDQQIKKERENVNIHVCSSTGLIVLCCPIARKITATVRPVV